MVRGIRGAITVEEDTPEAIHQATRELLLKMLEANGIQSYEELAAVIFTVTEDLTSAFPAGGAGAGKPPPGDPRPRPLEHGHPPGPGAPRLPQGGGAAPARPGKRPVAKCAHVAPHPGQGGACP